MSTAISRLAVATFILLAGPFSAAAQPSGADASGSPPRECWLRTPTVSIMTGFIYEPLKPYTIQQWMENLGNGFDADQWVRDFQQAGATHLVFYDKWIDGLVFHDTKTTNFKTRRDFVRELAAACQRHRLPLVLYFNAISDGNPEFDQWATLDKQGKPIVFGARWPTRYQTLHSPFRQKAVQQMRELLSDYGPLHGIWHDIFGERLNTSSPWVAKGYEQMFGEPFEKATGARLAEFNARTLAGYLDEVEAIRREQRQEQCLFTANGSGSDSLNGGIWTDLVGTRLQYLFNEGHSFAANEQLARMAWVLPKPLDINLLLNSSWFTPLEDTPPPTHLTDKQAIAAAAIAVCQGAGINLALTPGHAGTFGDDLRQAKAIGAWFRQVKPYLEDAQPSADVAIVLGTPAAGGPGLPVANPFWKRNQGRQQGAWQAAMAVSNALARCGVFSRILYRSEQGGFWPESLQAFRAVIVPELAVLDDAHLERLREYVRQGGRLIAFGNASRVDEKGQLRKDLGLSDVLGVQLAGEVEFPAGAQKAAVKVDSEYNEAFGARVLTDGDGEAWASSGTPMPHWVELALPQPVDVAGVELINRAGPYQITDFEVEVEQGGQWQRIKSVAGASGRTLPVPLTPPVRTEKVRVKILRELYQNQDRQYADVGAVRVLDSKGHDWVRGTAARIPVDFQDSEVQRLFGDAPLGWTPQAVGVEPATARTIAHLRLQPPAAAILGHPYGRGQAYTITASDACCERDDPFWAGVARLAAGEPTLTVHPGDAQRCRLILTRAAGAHVLHVIDSQADLPGAPLHPVSLSLTLERLGNPRQATLIGRDGPLEMTHENGRGTLIVHPDPLATVVFK